MSDETLKGESQYVGRYKGSPSRYTAAYTVEGLQTLVDRLFPLDEVYEHSVADDGGVVLRKLGSFKVEFIPLEASAGQMPLGVTPAASGSFFRRFLRWLVRDRSRQA